MLKLLLLSLMLLATPTTPQLTVKLTPAGVQTAPLNLRVEVRLVPNSANRKLRFSMVMEGEEYSLSEKPLDGLEAPKLAVFLFRDLPAGDYEGRATLVRQVEGKEVLYSARSTLLVVR